MRLRAETEFSAEPRSPSLCGATALTTIVATGSTTAQAAPLCPGALTRPVGRDGAGRRWRAWPSMGAADSPPQTTSSAGRCSDSTPPDRARYRSRGSP